MAHSIQQSTVIDNEKWLVKLHKLREEITKIRQREALLQAYLRHDPTILHYQQEWSNIISRATLITAELRKIELDVHKKLGVKNGSVSLTQIEKVQQEIAPYLPQYAQARLDLLKEQKEPTQVELARLRANPIFLTHVQNSGQLRDNFKKLTTQSVTALVKEISEYSRYLFLQIPPTELIDTKSERCPKFLAVTSYFNQLGLLVVDDVLKHSSSNARAAAYSYWIQVVKGLCEAGDFSSAKSICASLNSSPALYRLQNTLSGLADTDTALLKQLENSLSAKAMQAETDSRQQKVIPYLGLYRLALERAKVQKSQVAMEGVRDKLMQIQAALRADYQGEIPTSSIAEWGGYALPFKCDYKKLNNLLFEKSKRYEPQESSQLPSQLDSYQKTCWLNKLRNRELAEVLLQEHKVFSHDISQAQIDSLNEVVRVKLNDSEFRHRLILAGIYIESDIQIRQLNHENRQLYYRHLIDNSALKEIVKGIQIHNDSLGESTTQSIMKINNILRGKVDPAKLAAALAKIKIVLTDEELATVVQESVATRADSAVVKIEALIHDLKGHLAELEQDKELKQQLRDYLTVVNNSGELYAYDKDHLLENLTAVLPGISFRNSGYNPYLKKLTYVEDLNHKLATLQKTLDPNNLDQAFRSEVERLNRAVVSNKLIKAKGLLDRWVEQKGEPDESLKHDIAKMAPANLLLKLKIRLGLHERSDYLDEKLQLIRQRTQARLQPLVNRSLLALVDQRFTPSEEAFFKASKSPLLDSKVLDQLQGLGKQIKEADSDQALKLLNEKLQGINSPELTKALETFNQAMLDYTNTRSAVSRQFQLCSDLTTYVDVNASKQLDQQTMAQLKALDFGKRLKRGFNLDSSQADLAKIATEYPELNMAAFNIRRLLESLPKKLETQRQHLEAKDEPVLDKKAVISPAVVTKQPQSSQAGTTYSVFKWGAIAVGAVICAPIAVKAAGAVVVGGVLLKLTAGIFGAGAGARAGYEAEKVAEKRCSGFLQRFGAFRGKPVAEDKTVEAENTSLIKKGS